MRACGCKPPLSTLVPGCARAREHQCEMGDSAGVRILRHRAHTAGSQLLEVPTAIGKPRVGSDAYSSVGGDPRLGSGNIHRRIR